MLWQNCRDDPQCSLLLQETNSPKLKIYGSDSSLNENEEKNANY